MEVEIGNIREIPPGEGRNFAIGHGDATHRVAVFHSRDGKIHATQPDCPHKGGPLADGLVDNHSVVCPLHDRTFDFATGAGLGNECTIQVYKARLEPDGKIVVTLEPVTSR